MLISNLYKKVWNEWRQQDTIHLLINHRSYLDKEHIKEYPEFNEKNIKDYPYTFGIMAREVLDTWTTVCVSSHSSLPPTPVLIQMNKNTIKSFIYKFLKLLNSTVRNI